MLSWCDTTSRTQWAKGSCEDWRCFDLSLPSRSMDKENSAHNHWFLIFQIQKIGTLQVVASGEDIWDQIGKPSTPSSPMSSNYYHYFHTLLIASKNITRHWKLVLKNVHWRFSILIHYLFVQASSPHPVLHLISTNIVYKRHYAYKH